MAEKLLWVCYSSRQTVRVGNSNSGASVRASCPRCPLRFCELSSDWTQADRLRFLASRPRAPRLCYTTQFNINQDLTTPTRIRWILPRLKHGLRRKRSATRLNRRKQFLLSTTRQ